MLNLPNGTITFLFTDIEGSTVLWERYPEQMYAVIARHDALLYTIVQDNEGVVFKTVGDAVYAVFETAGEAVTAAVKAQRALAAEAWPAHIAPLRVRMALHTGEAERRENDYFGQALNRVARILAAGHGGQVLLSQATASLLRGLSLPDVTLHDLGEYRLKDIQHPEHIFQLTIDEFPHTFPPLRTLDSYSNNLPTQLAAFIGREKELHAVSDLLLQKQVRLVTLNGPAGVGKTRLSLQVAAQVAATFEHGVYFVEMETVREINAVAPAIVQALRIRDSGDQAPMELLKSFLKGRVLLVLDNFEQIVQAAPLLLELLMACHHLKILLSSRAALNVSGEQVYSVPPLTVPPVKPPFELAELAQSEAVALFIQRAREVKPDFQLTPINAAAVVAICAELDGLPLAIELAAARINLLSPQALLRRLGQRFKLLTGREHHRSLRQQTLRGAIAWSYDLLEPYEKTLFEHLSIFADGCTLEAIEAICCMNEEADYDLLDTLYSLINKSLLRQYEQENGEPRFVLLHTIREYAREQLQAKGKVEELQQRHVLYYLDLAEQALSALAGSEQRLWQARLEQEQENLHAALQWSIEQGKTEYGLRLAGALWRFWLVHGHLQRHYASLEKLLAAHDLSNVTPVVRARALEGISRLALSLNKCEQAAAFAQEMQQLGQTLDDQEIISSACVMLADIAMRQGNGELAVALLEQSLQLRRAMGDKHGMASLLNNMGNLALGLGQLEQARTFHEQSLALLREVGDEWSIARVLTHLGKVELLHEHYEQAIVLYEESLRRCRELGDARGTVTALFNLAVAAFCQDDYLHALDLYKESLKLFHDLDDQAGIAMCLEGIAEITYKWKQFHRTTRLLAFAKSLDMGNRDVTPQHGQSEYELMIDDLRTTLGQIMFEVLWESGSLIHRDQIVAEILAITAAEEK